MAGRRGSDGMQRIIDIKQERLHQRLPLIMGGPEDIAELGRYDDVQLDYLSWQLEFERRTYTARQANRTLSCPGSAIGLACPPAHKRWKRVKPHMRTRLLADIACHD